MTSSAMPGPRPNGCEVAVGNISPSGPAMLRAGLVALLGGVGALRRGASVLRKLSEDWRTARGGPRPGLGALADLWPYALIELVLPGGSVMALGLWLYRRYQQSRPARALVKLS